MGTQRHISTIPVPPFVAQHFDDFPALVRRVGRWSDQRHDHEPHPRAHDVFWRDKNVEAQAAVVRHQSRRPHR